MVTECNLFIAEIRPFPLKGPFEPWWRLIVTQRHTFQLEPKHIWQIVISSIPDVLIYKIPQVLMTGTIVQSMHQNEPESEILNTLGSCDLTVLYRSHLCARSQLRNLFQSMVTAATTTRGRSTKHSQKVHKKVIRHRYL